MQWHSSEQFPQLGGTRTAKPVPQIIFLSRISLLHVTFSHSKTLNDLAHFQAATFHNQTHGYTSPMWHCITAKETDKMLPSYFTLSFDEPSEILRLPSRVHQLQYKTNKEANINLLKPKTYIMYHQLKKHSEIVFCPQCIYVFCVDLRTNCDSFSIQC